MADTDDLLKMDLGLGSRTASQIDLSWLLPDSSSCVLSQKTMCVCVGALVHAAAGRIPRKTTPPPWSMVGQPSEKKKRIVFDS